MDRIIDLIKQDPVRVEALYCVFQLQLPQCYIAAGFVRNLVWDSLHDFDVPTPLNDIDVIYFDPHESNPHTYLVYEAQLKTLMPALNWQVRNQAHMHHRNGDLPYKSTLDAMSYWVEKETTVGIRLLSDHQYDCVAVFGYDSLFGLCITPNPKRSKETFKNRLISKDWLTHWSALTVKD